MALEKSQGNVGAAIEALRKYVDVFQTDRDAWEELGALYVQARLRIISWCQGLGHMAKAHASFRVITRRRGERLLDQALSLAFAKEAAPPVKCGSWQGQLHRDVPACVALCVRVQAQMYEQAAACYEEVLLHAPASVAAYVQLADVLYTAGGGSSGANFRSARAHYAAAVELSGGASARALYGLCAVTAQLGGLRVRIGFYRVFQICRFFAMALIHLQWHAPYIYIHITGRHASCAELASAPPQSWQRLPVPPTAVHWHSEALLRQQMHCTQGAADTDGLAAAAAAALLQRYQEEAPAHLLPLLQATLRAQGLSGKADGPAASPGKSA